MNDENLLKKIVEILEADPHIGDIVSADRLALAHSLQELFLEEHAIRTARASSRLTSPYINMTSEEFSKSWSL